MDGWLASNGSVSVHHLSFPLEFSTGSGVKREQQLKRERGGGDYYITLLGNGLPHGFSQMRFHIIHYSTFLS